MPKSHGKERQAQKQRKRREARRKARAARTAAESRRPSSSGLGIEPSLSGLVTEPAEPVEPGGYHPAHPLPPAQWLELSDDERLTKVRRYHEKALAPARRPPSMKMHVGLHVVVETQLAEGEPSAIRTALERLLEGGLRRHDAVHAIGWIVAEHMKRAMDRRTPVDEKAYAQALDQLTPASWRALATKSTAATAETEAS